MTNFHVSPEVRAIWDKSGRIADRVEAILRDQETAAGFLALARVLGSAIADAKHPDFDRMLGVFVMNAHEAFRQSLAFKAAGIPRFPNAAPPANDDAPRAAPEAPQVIDLSPSDYAARFESDFDLRAIADQLDRLETWSREGSSDVVAAHMSVEVRALLVRILRSEADLEDVKTFVETGDEGGHD